MMINLSISPMLNIGYNILNPLALHRNPLAPGLWACDFWPCTMVTCGINMLTKTILCLYMYYLILVMPYPL